MSVVLFIHQKHVIAYLLWSILVLRQVFRPLRGIEEAAHGVEHLKKAATRDIPPVVGVVKRKDNYRPTDQRHERGGAKMTPNL
jgi:hypothetical protein